MSQQCDMATKKVNGVGGYISRGAASRRAVTILLSFILARAHLTVQF